MLPARLSVALAAAFLAACGSVSTKEAERILLERVGPGEPVAYASYVSEYEADTRASELATLGLIEFKPGDFLKNRKSSWSITTEGASLGLTRDSSFVRGKLCDIVFASITQLGEPAEDSGVTFVPVDYALKHSGFTPLMEKLRGSKAVGAETCDAAKQIPQSGQLVRADSGWKLNNPPVFSGSQSTRVSYQYDQFGSRTGADNEMTVAAPTDADGDLVTLTWEGQEFDGEKLAPMTTLKVDGVKATFPGMRGALVHAIARDRFGGVDTASFCFQSSKYSC